MPLRDWLASLSNSQTGVPSVFQPAWGKRLTDPYYRFESVEEALQAARLGVRIDVNKAEVDDWLRLPGISIHQARVLSELTRSGVALHCVEDIAAAIQLPVQRLKPLEPILLFCYYDPESVVTIQPVNANTATVEMLLRIPGVDAQLARTIVENRRQGAYRNLPHLQRRLALSPRKVGELLHYLVF